MDNKKKIIIAVAVAAIIAIIAGVVVSQNSKDNNNKSSIVNKAENKNDAKKEDISKEVVKVTPTFMYFVSKSDDDYDKAMSVVETLKAKYGEKVKFDIVDVDENPEAKENFSLVNGQTPALIMLNTSNNISNFKFKCSDEAELASVIDAALN